jgi:hypothetical protein
MKPRIRPLWTLGLPLLWECFGRLPIDGILYTVRGHGMSPKEAYADWKAQVG